MRVEYRNHFCITCGHEQPISTNHEGGCTAYCHGCSWKSYGHDPKNASMFGGRTYRHFLCTEAMLREYDSALNPPTVG